MDAGRAGGGKARCGPTRAGKGRAAAALPRASYGVCSDPGLRPENQDFAAVGGARCFVVCDGVGGASLGGAMSRAAGLAALRAMVAGKSATAAVAEAGRAVGECKGLTGSPESGTTIVAARLDGDGCLDYSWVGDSMLYRLRAGALEALTRPHRCRGRLLSRALGAPGTALGAESAALERGRCPVLAGDRYVLCSDGVWEALGSEGMLRALSEGGPAPLAARRLVERAVQEGDDNASAIVVAPCRLAQVPPAGRR